MKKISVLHGPNLDRLGFREPDLYGTVTLAALNQDLVQQAQAAQVHLSCAQSDSEAEWIKLVYQAFDEKIDYLILNPAAFTHTSIAIRDALLAVSIPFVEVHISNIFAREPFRHHSFFSDIAKGVIMGFGVQSYRLALEFILRQFTLERESHGYPQD